MDLFNITYSVPLKAEDAETEKLFGFGVLSVSRRAGNSSVILTVLCERKIMERIQHERNSTRIVIEKVDEKDWVNEWVRDFHGIDIQGIFSIIPCDKDLMNTRNDSIKIYIDPRDAFGAGTHPTTELCLMLLHEVFTSFSSTRGITMLDIGTGSGILAIAGSLLGAQSVDACDLDEKSVKKAEKNCKLNNCRNIHLFVAAIENHGRTHAYDIVAANLQTAIIEQNFTTMKFLVKRDGYLVISGIDKRWKKTIERLINTKGGRVIHARTLNGWVGFLITFSV